MRNRIAIAGVALAVALAWAIPAAAATIVMDPDGNPATANNVTIDSFDVAPGNTLARGLTAASPPGTSGTVLFQANLESGDRDVGGTSTTQFASCFAGADCFTVVVGLSETVTTNVGSTQTFDLDPAGTTNFFRLYANDTQQGNDLTGSCFVGTVAGAGGVGCLPKTLVLEGSVLNDGSFFSSFTNGPTTATVPLDGFGANNYNGAPPAGSVNTTSITGTGSFRVNVDAWTFINPLYFPSGFDATIIFQASSENSLPFIRVNPSACFSSDGITGGAAGPFAESVTPCVNQVGVGSVGPINAVSGPNTMLQTDAGAAFVSAVPEPGVLALFGLGLVGAAAHLRRRRK